MSWLLSHVKRDTFQQHKTWENVCLDMMKKNLVQQAKAKGEKYAIALSASANKGKTSILKIFADGFRYDPSVSLVDMAPMGCGDEMWCFLYDDIYIGIATGGDDDTMIDTAFDFFKKNKCQIVFCATRYYSNSPSWTEFVCRCKKDGFIDDWQGVKEYSQATLSIIYHDIAENTLKMML